MDKESLQKEEDKFKGTIRPLLKEDLPRLKPIIETFVRDSETNEIYEDEVKDTLLAMEQSVGGLNARTYYVAEHEGRVLGVMGTKIPDTRMLKYAQTDNPTEVINAFVAEEHRAGSGVGTALWNRIVSDSQVKGFKEIVVNSGPRYEKTGWPFWDKKMGARLEPAKNYYGPGIDAPVWRKSLINPN